MGAHMASLGLESILDAPMTGAIKERKGDTLPASSAVRTGARRQYVRGARERLCKKYKADLQPLCTEAVAKVLALKSKKYYYEAVSGATPLSEIVGRSRQSSTFMQTGAAALRALSFLLMISCPSGAAPASIHN